MEHEELNTQYNRPDRFMNEDGKRHRVVNLVNNLAWSQSDYNLQRQCCGRSRQWHYIHAIAPTFVQVRLSDNRNSRSSGRQDLKRARRNGPFQETRSVEDDEGWCIRGRDCSTVNDYKKPVFNGGLVSSIRSSDSGTTVRRARKTTLQVASTPTFLNDNLRARQIPIRPSWSKTTAAEMESEPNSLAQEENPQEAQSLVEGLGP